MNKENKFNIHSLRFNKDEVDLIIIHVIFGICSSLTLFVPFFLGAQISFLVIGYIIIIFMIGEFRGYEEWKKILLLAVLISLFQIVPDWFLANQLGIIVFPDDSFFKIGSVSAYMAGLWTIPLFIIIYIGLKTNERFSIQISYLTVCCTSLLIFGLSEQFLTMIWYAENVSKIGNIAIYVIIPEILLGLTTFQSYCFIKDKPNYYKIVFAFGIMIFYLGSLSFFYFIIEKILVH